MMENACYHVKMQEYIRRSALGDTAQRRMMSLLISHSQRKSDTEVEV